MEFSERVLILQTGKFKEADLWIRFLSPTRGILSAFAFGGSRSRRRFVGCLDIFNEINVRVNSTCRGAYLALQEGVLIRGVSRLRGDWLRFGMAVNCIRFLQSFGMGPEGADKAYFLMQRTLRLLEQSVEIPRMLPLFFRTRLACDQGYDLQGDLCVQCGRSLEGERALFFLQEGNILCPLCAALRMGYKFSINPEALAGLRAVRMLSPEEWGKIAFSPGASREFAQVMDAFIQYHVGISWENGRFLKR